MSYRDFVTEAKTRPMHWATMIEVRKAFENRASITHWRDLTVIYLCMGTGCRPGEACKAKDTDFNLEKKCWYVPPDNEKTGKEKWYHLSDALVRHLEFYFRVEAGYIRQSGGFIVYSRKGGFLDEGKFTSLYNQVLKRAGLLERYPGKKTHSNKNKLYSIRAGVFCYLRDQGYKPEEILCLSQHSHVSTLERFYITYDKEKLNKRLIEETQDLILAA